MKYLEDWRLYNQKNKLNAKEFVQENLFRLIQFFNIDENLSTEEKEQILIDYFTKYPDQITSINVTTVGRPNVSVSRLNNIGGVVKYR